MRDSSLQLQGRKIRKEGFTRDDVVFRDIYLLTRGRILVRSYRFR